MAPNSQDPHGSFFMPHGRNGWQDMSDSTGASTVETPPEGTGKPQGEAGSSDGTPPEGNAPAGDTTDWKAEARKWEARSKENKTALDELTGKFNALETSNGELSQKVAKREADDARAALVAKVAEDAGVPAEALRGDDEAALTAHAESLKALLPSVPVIKNQDKTPAGNVGDPNREAVRNLFGSN